MWLILKKGSLNQFDIKSRLFPLKKLNVFIGANDSGKSYFLRELMDSIIGVKTTEELIDELKDNTKNLESLKHFQMEIFNNLDYMALPIHYLENLIENIGVVNEFIYDGNLRANQFMNYFKVDKVNGIKDQTEMYSIDLIDHYHGNLKRYLFKQIGYKLKNVQHYLNCMILVIH